ncbi:MAG: transketolase family protein [Dehalococcoidia bacterium]|nr:transketolase family protein [Dehalococcoidia bacterium]MDH4367388.1 transketolase family protein [Dehalococcoidia bacterium]
MAEASTREIYGKTLVELGRQNKDIVVLDADVSPSTMTSFFAREFPDRFFNCGLQEQNMISIAAGLAASGKTVFASTFAVFVVCRCFDQLRLCISQPNLNVKIVATHGGISVGEDGISHQAIEDVALCCSLPGFTVVVPADAVETAAAVRTAASVYGPFYIRLGRPKTPIVYPEGYHFTLGKAVTMRQGKDATIVATGIMVAKALEAADILARQNIDCRVLNMHTIKPLDQTSIVEAASETGAVVVAEEHLAQGGLGSRVAQILAKEGPVPMEFVNLGDRYAMSGKAEELLHRYGLTAEDIERSVKSAVKRK